MLALMVIQMQFLIREVWFHPLNTTRAGKGIFYTLYPDLWHYPKKFFGVFHMDWNQFDNLLQRLTPGLLKQDMNYQASIISPEQQLVVTLRSVFSALYQYKTVKKFETFIEK